MAFEFSIDPQTNPEVIDFLRQSPHCPQWIDGFSPEPGNNMHGELETAEQIAAAVGIRAIGFGNALEHSRVDMPEGKSKPAIPPIVQKGMDAQVAYAKSLS